MKYAPSLLGVGRLSRSSGSTTASHNKYGAYLRNRVIPVNPNTPKQAAARVMMANISQNWRTLTDEQRLAWNALGTQMTRVDSLGQTYTLSGLQAFTSINRNLNTAGAAFVSDAPAIASPASILTVTVTATEA